jgi:hypothetical protein
LVKAEAELALENGILCAAFGLLLDEPVQGRLPANNPVDEFLAQAAVSRCEPGVGQSPLQESFDKWPAGDASSQNLSCNFSWILLAQQL